MVATAQKETPNIAEVGKVLNNKDEVLSKRFRALFMLRYFNTVANSNDVF